RRLDSDDALRSFDLGEAASPRRENGAPGAKPVEKRERRAAGLVPHRGDDADVAAGEERAAPLASDAARVFDAGEPRRRVLPRAPQAAAPGNPEAVAELEEPRRRVEQNVHALRHLERPEVADRPRRGG